MKRAQSTLEYAAVIAVFCSALLAMQIYIKRGMQGRLRAAADELGEQYAPKNTASDTSLRLESEVTTEVSSEEDENGKIKTTTTVTIDKEEETRSGWETVGALESSLF